MEEEFEEFDDDSEEPVVKAKPVMKATAPLGKRPAKYEAPKEEAEEKEEKPEVKPVQEQAQPQYVAVPRAVPVETMLNELYDGQQEMRQVLMAILEKLK
jgi:hypothetical protein